MGRNLETSPLTIDVFEFSLESPSAVVGRGEGRGGGRDVRGREGKGKEEVRVERGKEVGIRGGGVSRRERGKKGKRENEGEGKREGREGYGAWKEEGKERRKGKGKGR